MSGFATVDEAFKFVAERPTILERLYERKKAARDQQKDDAVTNANEERRRDEA